MLKRRKKTPGPSGSGVIANTLFGLLTQVATAAFTTVLTLYLVRKLGPAGYGRFSLALSIGAVLLMFADFGLASSAGRYLAECGDEMSAMRRVANTVLRLKFLTAAIVAGGLTLLAPLIADAFGQPRIAGPLRFTGASLFFESLLMWYSSAFSVLRRVSYNALTIFLESLMETTASIALVVLGTGVTGAMAGRAVGYGFGVLVGGFLLARIMGPPNLRRLHVDRHISHQIRRYARPLLIINGAYTLYVYIDALLIGALLSSRDVGEFTAPLRLVTLAGSIGLAAAGAVSPRLAGDRPDTALFVRALRGLLVVQMFLMVPLLAWSEPIVSGLLGNDYRLAGQVLRALVPYALLYGIGPLITVTVTFMGGARERVPIVFAALAVNFVLDLILLPTIGVLGATIGTGVAFAIYVPAHMRILLKELDIDVFPLVMTTLRTLVALGAATLALTVIGTKHLSAVDLVAGAVVAPLMFFSVLLVLGEVRESELGWVRARLRRSPVG